MSGPKKGGRPVSASYTMMDSAQRSACPPFGTRPKIKSGLKYSGVPTICPGLRRLTPKPAADARARREATPKPISFN